MTDKKTTNILDLSPINSSKSSDSNSFFSPRELNLLPMTILKPENARLSLNEKPSILLKSQPDPSDNQGFNPRFRASFLKDLEKKGYFLQKSKLSLNGKSEVSTIYPQESLSQSSGVVKKSTEVDRLIDEVRKLEEKEKEQVNFFEL
jgi:hypothetical protein